MVSHAKLLKAFYEAVNHTNYKYIEDYGDVEEGNILGVANPQFLKFTCLFQFQIQDFAFQCLDCCESLG